MLAALNGLWGDHLADSGNPLAIPMTLRVGGKPLDLATDTLAAQLQAPTARLVVLVHGLCMNDLQWNRQGHDHGAALARDQGFTPLYLHYNSGRHISQNGRDFAVLLEQLVRHWPVPMDELVIIGHSMGGLVARSASQMAGESGLAWPGKLKKLVFLGTPHEGAPLERGGRLVDTLLGFSPYAAPFGRLGRARSAGITDLRYGNLQDADWQGRDHHAQTHDDRRPTPLPAGVDAYCVAATRTEADGGIANVVIGDGLVPVASALGEHRDPALALSLPKSHLMVVERANHWDLLNHPAVYAQLATWLGSSQRAMTHDQ
jgi:pimeloyl-ACP methyl ester carboxylesterase